MSYCLSDFLGLLLAVALTGPLLILPGLAIGQFARINAGRPRECRGLALPFALVAGYGALPVLDSLGAHMIGLPATLAAHLLLCLSGLSIIRRSPMPVLSSRVTIGLAIWLVVLALAWIDFDWNGTLHQSLLIKDMIKHAATVRSMVDLGTAPPADVFFLRDQPSGYYYYYYVLSALVELAAGGLMDSRAAVGGQVFWTGLALFSLILVLLDRAHLATGSLQARAAAIAALLAASGLEILIVLLAGGVAGIWFAQIGWWKEAVGGFVHSTLWVPHHVSAVIATWAGLLVLAQTVAGRKVDGYTLAGQVAGAGSGPSRRGEVYPVVFAGLSFASAFGLSVWVTFGSVAIAGVWGLLLLAERRWRAFALLSAAGVVALMVSLPHLSGLLANRAYDGFPIAFAVRAWPFEDPAADPGLLLQAIRLAWLPVNILLGFGVLVIGAIVFWRRSGHSLIARSEVSRLLAIAGLCGLVMSTFVKSTIVNNDLGWRVLLFAQVSALVWTASVMGPVWRLVRRHGLFSAPVPRIAQVLGLALIAGFAGTVYELVAMRASEPLGMRALARSPGHLSIEYEARGAYEWANRNERLTAVLQHNPESTYMLGFGLYGRLPVAIAPKNLGSLFGASRAGVDARLADIGPVFHAGLLPGEAHARLVRNRVDLVMVTAADPVWGERNSWVWASAPDYASARVRVLAVDKMVE